MNLAKSVEPYRHDALFTQSPPTIKNEKSPLQNAMISALLHRETVVAAFQYPFALNVIDCGLDEKGSQPMVRKPQMVKHIQAAGSNIKIGLSFAAGHF